MRRLNMFHYFSPGRVGNYCDDRVCTVCLSVCPLAYLTSAQQQLRWATVPEQRGPKNGGGAAVPLYMGSWISI